MTSLASVSVPSCGVPLSVVERLAYSREELPDAVTDLAALSGADQVLLLSTCERTELYGVWSGEPRPDALVTALLEHRRLGGADLGQVASSFVGPACARHLFRVTCGLESFVLGETDVVGQVKAAGAASRAAGVLGLELERLVAAAVSTSRRVHRRTRLGKGGGSVAAAAVRAATAAHGGGLRGRRVVVVGAGQLAAAVVAHVRGAHAAVTVCNRTKRHADRFAAAGARVVDLAALDAELREADVVMFGTAAPHRLLDAARLSAARTGADAPLMVFDLCVPRNVDPDVRQVPGVRLVDLADLRESDVNPGPLLADDVAVAESVVEDELARYVRRAAERAAAVAVRRLREDVEACAMAEVARATKGLPPDLQALVDEGIHRAVRRLAHHPTRRLVDAAVAGDEELVALLSGLFAGGRPRSEGDLAASTRRVAMRPASCEDTAGRAKVRAARPTVR